MVPLVLLVALIWWWLLPVAEVVKVKRGTALSAVYGTVRIEPTFIVHVRAQNSGFIRLADTLSAGRGSVGKTVEKSELLASIADETTARQLKQARADLQAAVQRAALPLPSAELLKTAEDNVQRLEKVARSATCRRSITKKRRTKRRDYAAWSKSERIERDRNLGALEDAAKKLEAQLKNSEIRSPMDGLLTEIRTVDGELVGRE